MSRIRFWLRWSLRDLRERWLLVTAIALTIALGTGGFAGMISTTQWREDAIDASAAKLAMHDLRLELAEGAAVPAVVHCLSHCLAHDGRRADHTIQARMVDHLDDGANAAPLFAHHLSPCPLEFDFARGVRAIAELVLEPQDGDRIRLVSGGPAGK